VTGISGIRKGVHPDANKTLNDLAAAITRPDRKKPAADRGLASYEAIRGNPSDPTYAAAVRHGETKVLRPHFKKELHRRTPARTGAR
jgi:hypothetical protein